MVLINLTNFNAVKIWLIGMSKVMLTNTIMVILDVFVDAYG